MKPHPLQCWENPIVPTKLASSPALGMFIVSASSIISECCSISGIDWLAVDMEASPATRLDLVHISQSLNGSSVGLFVRVSLNNQQYIEAALDVGAHGVIVPKVSTQEEAVNAVKSCYYPHLGTRGLNPIRCSAYFSSVTEYLQKANTVLCILQIETVEAMQELEAIATVAGVSGLFVGCGDLALSYGMPGQFDHPQFEAHLEKVLLVCKKNKIIPGIFAYSNILAKKYIEMGFQMVAFGNEIKFLNYAIENSLNEIRQVRLNG